MGGVRRGGGRVRHGALRAADSSTAKTLRTESPQENVASCAAGKHRPGAARVKIQSISVSPNSGSDSQMLMQSPAQGVKPVQYLSEYHIPNLGGSARRPVDRTERRLAHDRVWNHSVGRASRRTGIVPDSGVHGLCSTVHPVLLIMGVLSTFRISETHKK